MDRRKRKVAPTVREKGGLRYGEGYVMERTTASGEPRFVARWREPDGHGGARWRAKTFMDKEKAEDELRKIARRKRSGRYVTPTSLTVTDAVTASLDRREAELKASTVHLRRTYQRSLIDPFLGTVRVTALTTARVQAWLDELARAGRAHGTLVLARSILSVALADLVRTGELEGNVTTGTRVGGRKRAEPRVWSGEQARAVLAATADDAELHAFYRLALTTGMRPGELRGLRWDDIDLDGARLAVARTVTRTASSPVLGETTKTGARRVVALDPATVTALRAAKRAQNTRRLACDRWQPLGLVFAGAVGNILSETRLRGWHAAACVRAGVPYIALHALRHTFASLQAEAGTNPRAVMDIMGHKQLSMTMQYTHTSEAMRREAAATAAALLAGDATTSAADPDETAAMHTEPHTEPEAEPRNGAA